MEKYMENLLQNKWVWICVVLLILEEVIRRVRPVVKGAFGETIVSQVLSQLPKDQYAVIHNVMLKTDWGTSQVDHVVVSVYGIFVIEVKNYAGWITGTENSGQWTQTIYKKKSHFMNPVHQNYGHVKAIRTILHDPTIPIYPIVTFAGDAKLKVSVQNAKVVKYGSLKGTIKELSAKKVLDADRMSEIVKLLQTSNVDSIQNRKIHVETINQKKNSIKAGLCPRCGGQLVERNGKYGRFMGCSNYPKCRYTEKL